MPRLVKNPELKALLDRIYKRDPVRYQRLIQWVWTERKVGWSEGALIETLKMADPYLDVAPNWWAYCTKLLPKATGRDNEKKAAELKQMEAGFIAGEFMEFLKARRAK